MKLGKMNAMFTKWPVNVRKDIIKEHEKLQIVINFLGNLKCGWCGGLGHQTEKCATKFRFNAEVRAADLVWDAGALKGLCWDPN